MNILKYLTPAQEIAVDTKTFPKGAVIFREDEKCDSIGIIEYGKIEISTYLSYGEKVVYNLLEKDDMFGSNLIFSSKPYYKGNVVALTECKVRVLYKDVLQDILATNDDFLLAFLKLQSDFTKSLNLKIKLLSINSAKERIMFALETSEKGKITFRTVTDFSDSLGLTREATSRAISKLVEENLITYKNKTLYINKKAD